MSQIFVNILYFAGSTYATILIFKYFYISVNTVNRNVNELYNLNAVNQAIVFKNVLFQRIMCHITNLRS